VEHEKKQGIHTPERETVTVKEVAGVFAAPRRFRLARIFRRYIARVRAGISPALPVIAATATACWTLQRGAHLFRHHAGCLGPGRFAAAREQGKTQADYLLCFQARLPDV